jgi:hypothetical protein
MKLKPCPFCGNDLNQQDFWHETVYPYNRQKTIWSVNCAEEVGGCSAQMFADSVEEVVKKWNKRQRS